MKRSYGTQKFNKSNFKRNSRFTPKRSQSDNIQRNSYGLLVLNYPDPSLHDKIKDLCILKEEHDFFLWHLLSCLGEQSRATQIKKLKEYEKQIQQSEFQLPQLKQIFKKQTQEETNKEIFKRRAISSLSIVKKENLFRLKFSINDKHNVSLHFCNVQQSYSSRFSRLHGPDMFLSINYDNFKSVLKSHFTDILDLSKPFNLGKWQFLCSKIQDKKVIYVRIDKKSKAGVFLTADLVRSWLVDKNNNKNQILSKYNSRICLAFSTTICMNRPLQTNEFEIIDDICHVKDHTDDQIMTDGCGLISYSFMKTIANTLQLTNLPCAVQGRFGSCKGVSSYFFSSFS